MSNEKTWLEKQLEQASRTVESWPVAKQETLSLKSKEVLHTSNIFELSTLLSGKVSKVEQYRRISEGNADYDGVRVIIDLNLPEDFELYLMFKRLVTQQISKGV